MAGLVALAVADPHGLAAALAELKLPPTTSPHQRITPTVAWWEAIRALAGHRATERTSQLRQVLAAVRRGERPRTRSWIELPETVAAMRVTEIAEGLITNPVPALVSTPTDSSSSLQPEALLARISAAERDGWQPWQLDLEQALLRLPGQVDPEIVSRAAALRSPAGLRLARWLAAGPLPDPIVRVVEEPTRAGQGSQAGRTSDAASRSGHRAKGRRRVALVVPGQYRSSLHRLLFQLDPFFPPGVTPRSLGVVPSVPLDLLPQHREVTAAWLLTDLNQVLNGSGAALLSSGKDCGGLAGPALTLLLAYTLGAKDRTTQQAARDALITLSVAGHLSGRCLGEHLGALIDGQELALDIVLPALTYAVKAGILPDTWDVIAALLPEVLADLRGLPRALPNLLALAADLAATLSCRDHIPGLARIAGRRDASRTVSEARRLLTVLTGQLRDSSPL